MVNFGSRFKSGTILLNFHDIFYLTDEYTPISTRNRFLNARFEQPQSTFCHVFFFFAKIDVFSKVFLLVFRGLTGTGNLATQKKV